MPADRRGVAGLAGVMGEPGGIDAVGRLQRAEHGALELAAPRGADLALDRPAGEVVPEDDGVVAHLEDPRTRAGVDGRRARGDRVRQQPNSAGPGTTAAISVTARASGPSAPTRTATASRIVAGTASPAGRRAPR